MSADGVSAAACAGMVSAAVLLTPGCGSGEPTQRDPDEPVRRAAFRSVAARDFLLSCPAGAGRRETAYQSERFNEIKRLAAFKGAGNAVWLGENEWAGVARYGDREPCEAGEAAYAQALAAYSAALDRLAAAVAEHRQ